MLYESYQNKMKKFAGFVGTVRRFRVPIILALALVAVVCAVLLSVRGIVYDAAPCPASVEYGSPLGYRAAAVLADVQYEYAQEGEEWSFKVPVRAGEYRVRAVSEDIFGGKRYGKTYAFTILPRETEVLVSQNSVEYGSLPAVKADLAYGDTIHCTHFVYADISAAETEVIADESAIVALDREGNDVSGCYIFRPVSAPIGFTPRKISVRVQDASGVYDGTPLRFDGYELDSSTPLADGDVLIAQFDDEQTEAGEGENIPEIRVKNAASGKDVTARYDINVIAGRLTVQKRPLYVTTGSASKIYDGTPVSDGRYTLAAADGESGLLEGHREIFLSSASLTDAGSADNIMQFRIEDEGGRDVSANYSLFFAAGTLAVEKRQVFYSTGSGAWEYDGAPHSVPEYTVEESGGDTGLLPGHSHAVGTLAELTDAGTAENTTTLRITDAEGKDVTANYDAVCDAGTLTVTRRPVTLRTESGEWVYDGKAHSQPLHAVAEGGLPLIAGQTTRADRCAEITDAGSVQNTLTVLIFAADGKDVTANYDITYEYGTLTVLPRPITVTAASSEQIYDGTALTAEEVSVTSEYEPALAEGHTYAAQTEGSRTDAGEGANKVVSFTVRDAGGRDVTANYGITFAEGVLTVLPRPITVTAASAEKIYDGTALTAEEVSVTSEYEPALIAGHTYTAQTAGSRTDAGEARNRVASFTVRDAGGEDVTANYDIALVSGTLTVRPRPVTFRTAGNAWVYDGEAHSETGFALSASSANRLVPGHKAVLYGHSSFVDAGEYENDLQIGIVTQEDADVTYNYDLTYEYGTLTVHPRPITVTAESAEKVYDGLPLESPGIRIASEYDPALVEGHFYDFYNTGTRTDAGQGVCSVGYFRVFENLPDGETRDVTANYAVTRENGTLTVTRRPLTLKAGSDRKVYDGTPMTDGSCVWREPGLEPVSWHSFSVEIEGSITDAGSVPNIIRSVVVLENERDVTFNYEIACLDGTLTVSPLPILLQAGSASRKYDGTPLTCSAYEWIAQYEDRLLIEGHTARVTTQGSRTEIGESPNTIASYTIYSGTRDVTQNYEVTCLEGVLRVLIPDYTLKIRTGGGSKLYDGTPLTVPECEITESDLPDTFSVTAEADGSVWRAGRVRNTVHLEVIAPDGTDISRFVYVEYDYGILEVRPRPITVRTASNSWEYDGYSHGDPSAETTEDSLPLAEGDSFYCTDYVTIRQIGIKENRLELAVRKQTAPNEYTNVSECYDMSLLYGTLEITPSDLYEDIGIGLPPVSGGGGGGGGGGFAPVGSVYSQSGGMVYLRRANYGDYTGRSWRSTVPYGRLIDDTYSMNYLTSLALQNAGRQNSLIQIKMDNGEYVLPYYMATGTGNYTVQTSDVFYWGNTAEPYELANYFYEYTAEGPAGTLPQQYAALEEQYRSFVRNLYLAVPDSAQPYLNYVIQEQGFDASDPNIISEVAEYIQGAAEYNLDYNRILDMQTDIVVAFLRDFKEGVCQHYASAATLLYRMLGIPARYTVGYAVEAAAGTWTEVSSENAHAWVEVYIDGLGWVYVEVTGSGPVFGEGGGSGGEGMPSRIELKPVDEVKKYDGTPLTASAVEGANPADALLLRELLNEGYTYQAEFAGSITEVGESTSSILSFTLYDAGGQAVTGLKYVFRSGRLTVVEETVITVRPYALQKQYDGTPLLYGAEDYTVSGLPSGYVLVLSLEGVGLTDAGVLDKSALEGLACAVKDSSGNTVTDQFYIHFDMKNALTVSRRAITVASISETKLYDGTPLTNDTYWIAGGSLAPGETISVLITGSITDIGTAPNTIKSVSVAGAGGADVTKNYKIRKSQGILTVLG